MEAKDKDQEIQRKMNETDRKYEQQIREEQIQTAWNRWFDAVKLRQSTQQSPKDQLNHLPTQRVDFSHIPGNQLPY